MNRLQGKFYEKYAVVQTNTIRDFTHKIGWENRMIVIKGSRGVGKTTLILQHIKQNFKPDNKVLYVSLDDLYFSENKLYELADGFYKKGGELLALDEVHRYTDWAVELKNIYDDMPNLKIIFTGSSLLHLRQSKADLSRRAIMYEMPGLSFREFVGFQTGNIFKSYTLNELLTNHIEIAIDIVKKIKPLAYFDDYLNYGYFPFYLENRNVFHSKLSEIILTVLEIDIPQFASISPANIIYLKKLLTIISHSVPFQPNINSLSVRTGISVNTLKAYLKLLNDSELVSLLYFDEKGINSLNKPEKIYINNPNLMFNLSDGLPNSGNVRETFFYNQLKSQYHVRASKQADFEINENVFEIGGKNKQRKQISGIEDAILVQDGIEIGHEHKIPLWMFGFLY